MFQKTARKEEICTRAFERYYRELAYFASCVLKDKEAGEDMAQDVFVQLFEKGVPTEEEKELKFYLYVAVRNRCLDYLKHLKIIERHQQKNEEEEVTHDFILSSIIETETLSILVREIEALPAECRKVMRLSLSGYNSTEISQQLGVEPSTVRAQKQRGIAILKKTLPPQIYFVVIFIMR